ncbi:Methylosome subunit pICln [Oopsacas minuta]|uniref:Methylosome subunit pICln n=1 Tax=Oopsacas minuta TaxID=111878 RepID=A0AAV7JQ22_9METZ|nr:Methylosome subunit pICln [Oopsacas minuta]
MSEEEIILLSCPNTTMYVGGGFVGTGLLSVREDYITWESELMDTRVLQYTRLSMHAVSRDLTQFPHPCILCLLNRSDDSGDGELDEDPLEEVRFVPEQNSQLQTIYSAIAEGQNLHPDPEDGSSGDEMLETAGDSLGTENTQEITADHHYQPIHMSDGMQGVFTSLDEVAHLTPEGLELLNKLDGMLLSPKDMNNNYLQEPVSGNVGSLDTSEIGCEIEEGQFDDVTLMDA